MDQTVVDKKQLEEVYKQNLENDIINAISEMKRIDLRKAFDIYYSSIRVHDISFLSSERVFEEEEIAGLEIKYSKLTMVPDSTLMIGDIIASGETLIHCLRYVTDFYRDHGARLRNIIIFTIGGTKGIDILEKLTAEIRQFWPEFEGFITVYYEGIFSTYQDKGVSGINLLDVDFYWKGGIVARFFRNYPFWLF